MKKQIVVLITVCTLAGSIRAQDLTPATTGQVNPQIVSTINKHEPFFAEGKQHIFLVILLGMMGTALLVIRH